MPPFPEGRSIRALPGLNLPPDWPRLSGEDVVVDFRALPGSILNERSFEIARATLRLPEVG